MTSYELERQLHQISTSIKELTDVVQSIESMLMNTAIYKADVIEIVKEDKRPREVTC